MCKLKKLTKPQINPNLPPCYVLIELLKVVKVEQEENTTLDDIIYDKSDIDEYNDSEDEDFLFQKSEKVLYNLDD